MGNHGKQAALAREFGISGAAVSKLVKKGMPTDPDAAREWRQANLQHGRMRPDPGPSADTLLRRAQDLAEVAAVALRRRQFATVADELRAAMRRIPPARRGDLRLTGDLWLALIGAVATGVLDAGRSALDGDAGPDAAPEAEDEVGRVVYALACGEARIT